MNFYTSGIPPARLLATTSAVEPARQAASIQACQDAPVMGGSRAFHYRDCYPQEHGGSLPSNAAGVLRGAGKGFFHLILRDVF
jgi:hypothetical protein